MPIAWAQLASPEPQVDTRTLSPITVTAQPSPESPFKPVDGYIAKRVIWLA